jgi:hypothetical protein
VTVFWVVWDGAPEWLVRWLTSEGDLPVLRSLRATGVHLGLPPTTPNCQTPTGLATLFTGTGPPQHGVTGFWVPGGPDGLKGQRRAFDPGVLRRPPVWATDRQLRATFLHAPWVFAADGSVPAAASVAVDAYNQRVSREDLRRLEPGQEVIWRRGSGTFRLHRSHDGYAVGLPGQPPNPVGTGWTAVGAEWFRVVGDAVISSARFEQRVTGHDSRLVARMRDALAAAGPFAGETLGSLYRAGALGTPCTAGGDGAAEARLLDGVDLVLRPLTAAVRTLASDPGLAALDLVVAYLPLSDDIGHELLAAAVSGEPAHRPATEVLRATYHRLDELLGQLLERAAPADTAVVCSDHGMIPVEVTCYVNDVLVRAGLAEPAASLDDGADIACSRVWYHLVNNGLMLANHRSLPGGFLDDAAASGALAAGMAALRKLRTPSGRGVVTGFIDDHGRPVTETDPGSWQAYIQFAEGCLPWPDCTPGNLVFGPPLRSGAHHVSNGDPRLAATFTACRLPGGPEDGPGAPPVPTALSEVAGFVAESVRQGRRRRAAA